MNRLYTILLLFGAILTPALPSSAQTPLWPAGAPGALGQRETDIPTITPFLPSSEKATGASLVICPGGGYAALADHEGATIARWLNRYGVAAFVLKYRLGSNGYQHPIELQDAARAVRWVRAQAKDPNRVAIMGFSAGGHLAATLCTHFDQGHPDDPDPLERLSSRPDLSVLCYPVITMGKYTHQGSKSNLLGPHPSEALVAELSNELQVTPQTPPCFLWHTLADAVVPVENSWQYAQALRSAGVPFELHIYERGPHGAGLGGDGSDPAKLLPWTADCLSWLRLHGWLDQKS